MLPTKYVIQTCVAGLSLLLYVAILVTLTMKKVYKISSFYALIISMGICDVLAILHTYLLMNFRQWGILTSHLFLNYPDNMFLKKFTLNGFWYLLYTQDIGGVLLILNRFTALQLPLKHAYVRNIVILVYRIPRIYAPLVFSSYSFSRIP